MGSILYLHITIPYTCGYQWPTCSYGCAALEEDAAIEDIACEEDGADEGATRYVDAADEPRRAAWYRADSRR